MAAKKEVAAAVEDGPQTRIMNVMITFTDPILGTSPADPEIHRRFIGTKAPSQELADEEAENLNAEEEFEKAITVFPRLRENPEVPILYDYQLKGFFKDSCKGLRKLTYTESAKVKTYKQEIDKNIFVYPRQIPIYNAGEIELLQRPLRASTAQGERVALATSECIQAGSYIACQIKTATTQDYKAVIEWLNYGRDSGIGQWRGSGKGRFYWEQFDDDGNVIGGNKDSVMQALEADHKASTEGFSWMPKR